MFKFLFLDALQTSHDLKDSISIRIRFYGIKPIDGDYWLKEKDQYSYLLFTFLDFNYKILSDELVCMRTTGRNPSEQKKKVIREGSEEKEGGRERRRGLFFLFFCSFSLALGIKQTIAHARRVCYHSANSPPFKNTCFSSFFFPSYPIALSFLFR